MSKEAEALDTALESVLAEKYQHEQAGEIITALAAAGYIITLDPTPLDGSDTKGANLALQRLRELGYVVSFEG